jgi:hypothetical protein
MHILPGHAEILDAGYSHYYIKRKKGVHNLIKIMYAAKSGQELKSRTSVKR